MGHYVEIVKQKHALRTIINTAVDMTSEAYDEKYHPIEILDHAESKIFELSKQSNRGQFESINPVVEKVLDDWSKEKKTGIFPFKIVCR